MKTSIQTAVSTETAVDIMLFVGIVAASGLLAYILAGNAAGVVFKPSFGVVPGYGTPGYTKVDFKEKSGTLEYFEPKNIFERDEKR